jgi:predicted lipid-binding transport protein (Tim44 family)
MRHIALMIFASFIGLALGGMDAEAKRLGGGKSMGRSAPVFKPRTPPQATPAQQPRQSQQQAARTASGQPRASGASRWLGPLAGLAAGGLLASLFFGDAFEGFQFFDFLLIGLLIFGAVMLFRALRARSAPLGPRPAPAPAGMNRAAPRPQGGRPSFEIPEIRSAGGGAAGPAEEQRPAWFDEAQFLRAAKNHFVRLQAAWDVGNMEEIREYMTPQLFAELEAERRNYGGQRQYTEVVSVDTELLGLATERDHVVASVRYGGMIREEKGAPAHPFTEIWHIERSLRDPKANWYIAGIEQGG